MSVETPNFEPPAQHPRPRPHANYRRDVIIILLLVIVAALIAWRGGVLRASPKIAIISSTEAPYWDRVFLGAQRAADQLSAEVATFRSKPDGEAQMQLIKDLQAKGYNAFAISPVNPETESKFLNELSQKVALVTVDSDCPDSNRAVFIGTANYRAGRQCGEMVKEAIPDGGEVIISVGSIDKENGRLRRQGLIDDLLDRSVDRDRQPDPLDPPLKGEKYTVVATLVDGVDPVKASSLAADAIKQHPNVKCIVGLFGYSAPAMLDALKQAGKTGQIKILGFDNDEATLAGIEAGTIAGTLIQDQFNMGYNSVLVLRQLLEHNANFHPNAEIGYMFCQPLTNAEDVKLHRSQEAREQTGAPN